MASTLFNKLGNFLSSVGHPSRRCH